MSSESETNRSELPILPLAACFVIVGVFAALAVPNMLNAINRDKQKRTMSGMRSIGTAVESYQIDRGHPPHVVGDRIDIGANLGAYLVPTYIKELPAQDGWGHPFLWTCDGAEAYSVASRGKDNVIETYAQSGQTVGFEQDMYYSDGQFTAWPEGTMN